MSLHAGLDSGSTTSKLVVLDGDEVVERRVVPTSHDPVAAMGELVGGRRFDSLVATGYGRDLVECETGCATVSEVRAIALGLSRLRPGCATVVDIGGQDSKVIRLRPDGRIAKFEMNDRCAAGTGRFLEMAAHLLGMDLDAFSRAALEADEVVPVASMCAVFAESELITHRSRGADRDALARGVLEAVGERIAAMISRTGAAPPLAFTGGCALGGGLVEVIHRRVGGPPPWIPAHPLHVGALGAALVGRSAAPDGNASP